MSARAWKPGDLAWIPGVGLGLRTEDGGWLTAHDGSRSGTGLFFEVRPVVVIDPEDREQVERLLRIIESHHDIGRNVLSTSDSMAALREFANPTPPKPEEPTGLGAVVEDNDGRIYIRAGDGWLPEKVIGPYRNPIDYSNINAVRVLSPGVPS